MALQRRLRYYSTPDVSCIDEVGYLSYSNRHADLLFEIINRRYEQKSTLITTNRPFSEWGEVFPGAACVVSLIDRLIHHAEIISFEGESYRLKEAKERAEKKQKKRTRRAMLPHNILGLLSPTFIRLRSEWEMPWSPCVRLNYAQNPAPLRLPQMAGRLFGMQFLPPSRATSALRISELPCRLPGTKNHHSA
ncbi:hypothetical protein BPLS_P2157 [Bathymodiolus platifrons methanotrophic gill symbiont]|nr:hypothetical protein BPLS_P2157 [Bathymodiolus platifrons methanotrophic gill symbiont]